MQLLYTILIMLLVVGGTRITAQFVPIPLPLIQIAIGALLAMPALGLHVRLDPELFLLLFIPPLLFVDGWRMPKGQFWRLRTPILLLAFGLVLFTVLGAGWLIHLLLPQVPLAAAFALAAVLSPTDAVAVSAIVHGRLPRTLMNILQGEALMNDASGLVAFKFAVAAALTGAFSPAEAGLEFVLVAIGGLAVGVALSYALGRFRAWMIGLGWEEPAPHVMFMLLLPFAAYVAAEHLGVSGILSAVAAGMMQSRLDLLPRQTTTRLLNRSVWALLEFTFNGLIFLLLGLQLPDIVKASIGEGELFWTSAGQLALYVGQVYLALILLRFVWTWLYWLVSGALRRWRGLPSGFAGQSSLRLAALLTLSGVRGAVTLAGVLSLPLLLGNGEAFPQRDLLIFIAAGVILLSLLVATLGLPLPLPLPLLLRGLPADNQEAREQELRRNRAKTVEAAIRALEAQSDEPGLSPEGMALATEVKAKIMAEYRQQLEREDSGEGRARLRQMDALEQRLRLQALRSQRLELYRLRHRNQVDDDLLGEILRELDISEARLHRG
jgi:Na+/H+ antiporter